MGQDSVEWATWTCATCRADMDDPVTVSATTCAHGHTNYLGPVHQSGPSLYAVGLVRRAYATESARRRGVREEKQVHKQVQEMFKAWTRTKKVTV